MESLETRKIIETSIGKTIASLEIVDNVLCVGFTDLSGLMVSDHEQECCETRYMSTEDDLTYHVGAQLFGIDTRAVESVEEGRGYAYHDTMFLELRTSLGVVSFANHNVHNGNYDGFSIHIEERCCTSDPNIDTKKDYQ